MAQQMNEMQARLSQNDQEAFARQQQLVDLLKQRGCLSDPTIEAAFRAVPRHLFLPEMPLDTVYADEAIPTKMRDGIAISSSSQPAVMATMLEQLEVQPGHHILEIGAGTGYNAALLATLAGEEGLVVTIDIDDDLVTAAQDHLKQAGFSQVRVVCGDGIFGFPDAAPYDRIILTVGAWDIAPAWIEQLKPGGRLLLPLVIQSDVQLLVAFERAETHLRSVSVRSGSFMPLRGVGAGPRRADLALGPTPGLLFASADASHTVNPDAVYHLLASRYVYRVTSVRASSEELWSGVSLWLALHAPNLCHLTAMGTAAQQHLVLDLFGDSTRFQATIGLFEGTTLCVLLRSSKQTACQEASDEPPSWIIAIRRFGPDEQLAEQLLRHLIAWEQAGRPTANNCRIRVYSQKASPVTEPNTIVLTKRWHRIVLDWP